MLDYRESPPMTRCWESVQSCFPDSHETKYQYAWIHYRIGLYKMITIIDCCHWSGAKIAPINQGLANPDDSLWWTRFSRKTFFCLCAYLCAFFVFVCVCVWGGLLGANTLHQICFCVRSPPFACLYLRVPCVCKAYADQSLVAPKWIKTTWSRIKL